MVWNGSLNNLIPLIDFLADAFGTEVEFVLHDLSKPGSTIIAIRNGHVTGRKVGDSLSDFTLKTLKEQVNTIEDFINFKERTMFRANLKSSDLLFKNDEGETIGLMCVNFNKELLLDIRNFIDNLIEKQEDTYSKKNTSKSANENIEIQIFEDTSFKDVAISIIDSTLAETNIPVDRMTPEEKINITSNLRVRGVFQLKGIVPIVASKLNTSEATIYRYLNNN